MILAGDIGGTNTRLALYEKARGSVRVAEGRFLSKNYPNLLSIVQTFLKKHDNVVPTRAVFGLAGPIEDGQCQVTNLPWFVDAKMMEKELKIPSVTLINDLEAFAWGLQALKPQELCLLHAGKPKIVGNKALIAAGTGLGEAGLYWDGRQHHPFATEGGNADFSPRNDLEFELMHFLKKTYTHVSAETVISGPGLYLIYQFLIDSGYEKASKEVQKEMSEKDPSEVVSDWGRHYRDPACTRAVEWFISLYGAEAGNLALKVLARGGVYVAGKIATIFAENIKKGGFVKSFLEKGVSTPLMNSIPIYLVLNEETPLFGAFEYARAHQGNTE